MEKDNIKTIANNKKAAHDYFLLETYEAGIELYGTEVKSVRQAGHRRQKGRTARNRARHPAKILKTRQVGLPCFLKINEFFQICSCFFDKEGV